MEHIWQIHARVSPLLKEGKIIISDRYIWDSTIDLAVSFKETGDWVVNRANQKTWARVPQADLKFFLDVPSNVALQRKNDIPVPEYIFQRIGLYQQMANHQHMTCLDGCADVNFLHNQIVQAVVPLLLQRK